MVVAVDLQIGLAPALRVRDNDAVSGREEEANFPARYGENSGNGIPLPF